MVSPSSRFRSLRDAVRRNRYAVSYMEAPPFSFLIPSYPMAEKIGSGRTKKYRQDGILPVKIIFRDHARTEDQSSSLDAKKRSATLMMISVVPSMPKVALLIMKSWVSVVPQPSPV